MKFQFRFRFIALLILPNLYFVISELFLSEQLMGLPFLSGIVVGIGSIIFLMFEISQWTSSVVEFTPKFVRLQTPLKTTKISTELINGYSKGQTGIFFKRTTTYSGVLSNLRKPEEFSEYVTANFQDLESRPKI